ncbi:MAG: substrate-binding domain-containing protein [Oscillospiraceae bacterium]|jgi:phosphate transport system substrate-binding protein|nr:substrate-binding domain-containing protein [Oscillospiraceae bacterium]
MWIVAAAFAGLLGACFIKNRVAKALLCVAGFLGFLYAALLSAVFILPNIIGRHGVWLPFVYFGILYAVFILFIFKPFRARTRRIAVLSAAGLAVAITAVSVASDIYRSSVPQVGEEVNLYEYAPFGNDRYVNGVLTHQDSSVAKLAEESALKLGGELPRLDGATALYPLYSAFTRAAYPEPDPNDDTDPYNPYADLRSNDTEAFVVCTTTPDAFENLIGGYADIVFLMGVSGTQREAAKGLDLTLTPIGRDAFIFFVNSRNTVTNLSTGDIRRIYSGEVKNWSDVGGGSGAIMAYQRPDESGSQTMLKQIMGSAPLAAAPVNEIFSTMMGMIERVADYRNYKNSLGYSFLYYTRDMTREEKIKLLSVDGTAPTPENIANGSYPFANELYAVTARSGGRYLNPERAENIDKLLAWLTSPQGQSLVAATGYLPL